MMRKRNGPRGNNLNRNVWIRLYVPVPKQFELEKFVM